MTTAKTYSNVLELIGNTPMLELKRIAEELFSELVGEPRARS